MIKYFLSIFISLLFFNQSLAKDISIKENIDLEFVCDLEKKIIKNSEYNYQTFLAKDLNEKGLDKFVIRSKQPETLLIKGLSLFLSESAKLNVKVVKNMVEQKLEKVFNFQNDKDEYANLFNKVCNAHLFFILNIIYKCFVIF